MRKILLVILALGIVSVVAAGTFADFSDIEVSTGNTFETGSSEDHWVVYNPQDPDADNLVVDTERACIGPFEYELHLIKVKNIGEEDITIDKVSVSWVPADGENVKCVRVFDWDQSTNISVWDGSEPVGTELDIDDLTFKPWKSLRHTNIFAFGFDSDMKEKTTFTITFIMDDGSTKAVTFTPEVMESGGKGGGEEDVEWQE